MRHRGTRNFMLFMALALSAVTIWAALPDQNHKQTAPATQKTANQENADGYTGPIVDYDEGYKSQAVTEPEKLMLRQARSRRYNKESPQPLGEFPSNFESYDISSPWYVGLPPLPVAQSDAIVRGGVLEAKAYLSSDKTCVYSEFTISLEDVPKNSAFFPLKVGTSIIVEREGGGVKFSDGRLFRFTINHQRMPRVGHRYVFFLIRNDQGQDFDILTGYELEQGKVSPLDVAEQFDTLKGLDEPSFLSALQVEVAHSSRPQKDKLPKNK